ncbi:glycosyltransferase [Candidatus Nomurabacteria bacterium]|nr:glycosyltransferase [Candidatus Nomurabacteria bacterium]
MSKQPRIAIVHDWLTNLGGAERTVRALLDAYPRADLYTSVYDKDGLDLFRDVEVRTTWLQKIPGKLKFKHQLWVPLRPLAFRSLNLKDYDIIISSSSAEAKQVRGGSRTVHICYCHTPIRYFWVNPEKYMREPGLGPLNFLAPVIVPLFLKALKRSDYKAAQKIDVFIANSKAVQSRIAKYYDRDSKIVYPPVQIDRFRQSKPPKRAGFITAGRQVAYKRHDLAIEACNKLELPLLVLGNGPEHERLKHIAGPTITFNSNPSDQDIEGAFKSARAFIHPGEEDFGITPIEAMAAGTPVIAYMAGGALDYIKPAINGEFFDRQTPTSLEKALKNFDTKKYKHNIVSQSALEFSLEKFQKNIAKIIDMSTRP